MACDPDFLVRGWALLHHDNQVISHFPKGSPEARVDSDARTEFWNSRLCNVEVGLDEVSNLGGVTSLLLSAPKDNDDYRVVRHDNAISVISMAAGQVADEIEPVNTQGPKAGFKGLLKLPLVSPVDAELIGKD